MQMQSCCTGRLLQALKALHCAASRGGDLVESTRDSQEVVESGSVPYTLHPPATSAAQDAIMVTTRIATEVTWYLHICGAPHTNR